MKRLLALAGIIAFTLGGVIAIRALDTEARISTYLAAFYGSFEPLPPRRFIRFGLIDHLGTFVVNPQYRHLVPIVYEPKDQFIPYSDGLIPSACSSRWGFADKGTGHMIIPAQYADVETFSEGLASVGVLDRPEQVHKVKRSADADQDISDDDDTDEKP